MKLEPNKLLDNLNTAVVIINADFNICYANFAAQRLFERSLNQLVKSDLRDYFLNRSIEEERLLRAMRTAEEFTEKEHTLFLGRGEQYPIAMAEELNIPDLEAFRGVIKETHCWKAAGPDQMKVFWWLSFGGALEQLNVHVQLIWSASREHLIGS